MIGISIKTPSTYSKDKVKVDVEIINTYSLEIESITLVNENDDIIDCGINPIFELDINANGEYRIVAVVNGVEYDKVFTINTIDNVNPVINVDVENGDWAKSHTINIQVNDNDSKLKAYYYAFSTSSTETKDFVISQSNPFNGINAAVLDDSYTSGEYYLYVYAIDNALNESLEMYGVCS